MDATAKLWSVENGTELITLAVSHHHTHMVRVQAGWSLGNMAECLCGHEELSFLYTGDWGIIDKVCVCVCVCKCVSEGECGQSCWTHTEGSE